jgi:hypothetical protein
LPTKKDKIKFKKAFIQCWMPAKCTLRRARKEGGHDPNPNGVPDAVAQDAQAAGLLTIADESEHETSFGNSLEDAYEQGVLSPHVLT